MTEPASHKPGVMFWVLGIIFLLWGLMGCAGYLVEVTMSQDAYIEAYGEAMAAVRESNPIWAVAAYAIAVWSGLVAAILLLLRRKISAPIFLFSLIAALISFAYFFTNADARAAAGSYFWVMPTVVIIIGIIEIWWSRRKAADGTLR